MTEQNYQRELDDLRYEWASCERCYLSTRRKDQGAQVVMGQGVRGGIMVISGGPTEAEEESGRPLSDEDGDALRNMFAAMSFSDYYLTHIVGCRSWSFLTDGEGQTRMRRVKGVSVPVIGNVPPRPEAVEACASRVYAEIYHVDPTVILTLGTAAASMLIGRQVTAGVFGEFVEVKIPGAARLPSRTEKRQVWARKVRGEWVMPTVQNQVRYLALPLPDLYTLRQSAADRRQHNAGEVFVNNVKKALTAHLRYRAETAMR